MQHRAALILPTDGARWQRACLQLAERRGWEVTDLVGSWEEWVALACDGWVDIGIVPRWDMLPPGRTPRLVSLEEPAPPDPRRPAVRWSPTRAARSPRR